MMRSHSYDINIKILGLKIHNYEMKSENYEMSVIFIR